MFAALVAAAALALPAEAPDVTYAADCGTTGYLEYREASWSLGCMGGSFNVYRISWTQWIGRPRLCLGPRRALRRYFSRSVVRVRWWPGNPFGEDPGWSDERHRPFHGGCTLSSSS